MRFELFDKEFENIGANDVEELIRKSIKEGWFVEFKGRTITSQKLGKSISSFANQEGGWFFLGIDSNNKNEAVQIIGYELEVSNVCDWVRDSIKGNITPFPSYSAKIVGIENSKEVLVIKVEKGHNAPYVCSDGRIYVRNDSGSDPVKDKHSLDELLSRKKYVTELIECYSNEEYTMSKSQDERNNPYMEIQFFPENFLNLKNPHFNKIEELELVKEIFNGPINITADFEIKGGIIFDKAFFSHNSIILTSSSCTPYSHIELGLTIEIRADGTMKSYIPLTSCAATTTNPSFFIREETLESIIEEIGETDAHLLKLIDGYNLFLLNMNIVASYKKYIDKRFKIDKISSRIKLGNVWRTLLVFENNAYREILIKHGFPITLKNDVYIPNFIAGRCLLYNWGYFNYTSTFIQIVEALGFPMNKISEIMISIKEYFRSSPNFKTDKN